MGIDIRTTMDIDTNVTGISFELDQIKKIIVSILSISVEDGVSFELLDYSPIKEESAYGGFKFKILGLYENIKIRFSIDVSTGDIVTPSAVKYEYKTLFDNEYISLYTYNYETIIAEKIETVLKRKTTNSRMKDYYDIYYFITYKWNEIDRSLLREAINATFNNRDSNEELRNYNEILKEIDNNENLGIMWEQYKKKHGYANGIEFGDIIVKIRELLERI